MSDITVEADRFGIALSGILSRVSEHVEASMEEPVRESAKVARKEWKAGAPKKTGAYAASITYTVKKATGAGAMAYVTKPYEESKLMPALEVAMGRFAEINDLLDNVERSENKLRETEEQLRKAEEKLKKTEETLEERKLVDRAKGLLMDKADFSEQGAFRWIQKTSMDQRIPKKRLALAIIAKYGDAKPEPGDER